MNNKRANIQPPGVTLIELLVYMGVATIVLLAVSAFSFTLLGTHQQAETYRGLYQDSTLALEQMAWRIEQGYALGDSSVFDRDLVRTIGELAIETSASESPIRFFVQNQTLLVQEGDERPTPLHGTHMRITRLVAQNLSTSTDAQSVSVSLSFSRSVGFGLPDAEVRLSTTIQLKDYAP